MLKGFIPYCSTASAPCSNSCSILHHIALSGMAQCMLCTLLPMPVYLLTCTNFNSRLHTMLDKALADTVAEAVAKAFAKAFAGVLGKQCTVLHRGPSDDLAASHAAPCLTLLLLVQAEEFGRKLAHQFPWSPAAGVAVGLALRRRYQSHSGNPSTAANRKQIIKVRRSRQTQIGCGQS